MTSSTLSSMTGFAQVSGGESGRGWTLSLKSVNGKGLDIRQNLRPDLETLAGEVRRIIGAKLHRGNVTLSVSFEGDAAQGQSTHIRINQRNLSYLVDSVRARAGQKIDAAALASLMTIRGVVEPAGHNAQSFTQTDHKTFLADIQIATEGLITARLREGHALFVALSDILSEMRTVLDSVKTLAKTHPEAVRAALMARLDGLNINAAIADEKLENEIALMAVKADVQEEITRLDAHINDATQKLEAGSPVGKPLDFLAQEMRRETNTICSKAQDIALTKAGLKLKALIDQFKEQAANVE